MKGFWSSDLFVYFATKWFVWCNFGKSYGHLLMFEDFPGWRIPILSCFMAFCGCYTNYDHLGLDSGSSMAKVMYFLQVQAINLVTHMMCSLIVLGCSRCLWDHWVQHILDVPPQMVFRICSWPNCPEQELCIRACAFLFWGILFIFHVSICVSTKTTHKRWSYLPLPGPFLVVSTKTLNHNHCHVYIYVYTYFSITISHVGICFPPFPETHRGIILRIWWLPSMWRPALKEGTNLMGMSWRWVMNLRISLIFGILEWNRFLFVLYIE